MKYPISIAGSFLILTFIHRQVLSNDLLIRVGIKMQYSPLILNCIEQYLFVLCKDVACTMPTETGGQGGN